MPYKGNSNEYLRFLDYLYFGYINRLTIRNGFSRDIKLLLWKRLIKFRNMNKLTSQCKDQWQEIQSLGRRTIEQSIDLGDKLSTLRQKTKHGEWSKICKEIGIHDRQASRLILAFHNAPEELDNITFSELIGPAKSDKLSDIETQPGAQKLPIHDKIDYTDDPEKVSQLKIDTYSPPKPLERKPEIEDAKVEPEPEKPETKAPRSTLKEDRTIKNDPVAKAYHDIYEVSQEYKNITTFRVWLKKELDILLQSDIKVVDSRVNDVKKVFMDEYDGDYYWEAKDGKAAKTLIKKIESTAKKNGKILDGGGILNTVKWLMGHADDWVKERMSMTLLNSKFNEIVNNGKSKSSRSKNFKTKEMADFLSGK